jgi:hypothetical protein
VYPKHHISNNNNRVETIVIFDGSFYSIINNNYGTVKMVRFMIADCYLLQIIRTFYAMSVHVYAGNTGLVVSHNFMTLLI